MHDAFVIRTVEYLTMTCTTRTVTLYNASGYVLHATVAAVQLLHMEQSKTRVRNCVPPLCTYGMTSAITDWTPLHLASCGHASSHVLPCLWAAATAGWASGGGCPRP